MRLTTPGLDFARILKFRLGKKFSAGENQIIATAFNEAIEDLQQQKAALSNVLEAAAREAKP